jgi:serine/threonine protein kinase
MKKLESPYTVHLLDMLTDLENNYFFLVMNLEENGNIEEFIANNPNMNDSQIIGMFIQILQGLIYLKENKIIHGDLKPQNILLSSSNSPKLADFGLSTQLLGSRI